MSTPNTILSPKVIRWSAGAIEAPTEKVSAVGGRGVNANRILGTTVLDGSGGQGRRILTLVPDIELVRVEGVHGPPEQ